MNVVTEIVSPLTPSLVVAYIGLVGTLATIATNGYLARRERKRGLFAEALSAVMEYWEFPYVVRRRRGDARPQERIRISEALREVQARLSFHQAWIGIEGRRVSRAFDGLLAETRTVMGSQMRVGWNSEPTHDDTGMNITDIERGDLELRRDAYLTAVRDHLSLWPTWIRRVIRWVIRSVREWFKVKRRSYSDRVAA